MSTKTFLNPREALEKFYSMDTTAAIPSGIAKKLAPMQSHSPYSAKARKQQRAIEQLFTEPRISLEQREIMATSILAGRVEIDGQSEEGWESESMASVQKRSPPRVTHRDYEKERIAALTLTRHTMPPSIFIALEVKASPIRAISGRDVVEARRKLQRSRGVGLAPLPPSTAFRSPDSVSTPYSSPTLSRAQSRGSPSTVPTVLFDSPSRTLGSGYLQLAANTRDSRVERRSSKASCKEAQNVMVAEHVKRRTERSLQDLRQKAEVANEVRKLEQGGVQRRVGVQKRLAEFKKRLKDYLRDNHDPMRADVMRILDDSTLYQFMEDFQGYDMTIPAMLALIGSALGTHMVNPLIPAEDVEEDLAYGRTQEMKGLYSPSQNFHRAPPKARDPSSEVDCSFPAPSSDSRKNTPHISRGLSGSLEQGVRGQGDSRSISRSVSPGHSTTSISRSNRTHSRPALSRDSLYHSRRASALLSPKPSPSRSLRKHEPKEGQHSRQMPPPREVQYLTDEAAGPRRFLSPSRELSPEGRTRGGGFLVDTPHTPYVRIHQAVGALRKARGYSEDGPTFSRSDLGTSPPPSPPGQCARPPGKGTSAAPLPRDADYTHTEPLVIFGSDSLRRAARELGFYTEKGGYGHGEGPRHGGSGSMDGRLGSPDSPERAINAMEGQLREEELLPSQRPERFLSEDQIQRIAREQNTTGVLKDMQASLRAERRKQLSEQLSLQKAIMQHPSSYEQPSNDPPAYPIAPVGRTADDSLFLNDSLPSTRSNSPMHLRTDGTPVTNPMSYFSSSSSKKHLLKESLTDRREMQVSGKDAVSLYGSVLNSHDQERLGSTQIRELEVERGGQRHRHMAIGKDLDLGWTKPALVFDGPLGQPPLAIKTKEHLDEQNKPTPVKLYKTYTEQTDIMNSGIASGAGLMLWRPRNLVAEGRAGQSRASGKGPTVKNPFVSAA
ncbi:hypothetical protein B484DRAFT_148252 [Ochromonadaceae sp. CCMP2298]|nr:hypothetical protein B484DRAFT_148252 [Ochromonadaceae sp. CCMP2298]|mmetsp:Transcript_25158/g.54414  ORF Transcript_25158/g.54414 Transcript_25158/m.54414 type:complete len:949 (+) Transcript_25158:194-3040(+)